MEAIGAVASLLQVAQFGTQLSIGLYQVAESIATANQETSYIAKDIALFCQVLKDLAKALESGRKVQLFRQNAFDTTLKIVDECKRVFSEIEAALKKATKCNDPLSGTFDVPTGHKVLWIFRKGKVDFYRRLLDSLKSTILVELAVLNYALSVTIHSTKNDIDINELLALKSLVMANNTAKQELLEEADNRGEALDSETIASTGVYHPSILSSRLLESSTVSSETADPRSPPIPTTIQLSQAAQVPSHAPFWSQTDRLEMAAQKLELAKWEYSRYEENIALDKSAGSENSVARHEYMLNKLKDGLIKFGMRDDLVEAAMNVLGDSTTTPERRAVLMDVASGNEQSTKLETGGVLPIISESSGHTSVLRWLPDLFIDILYEHTQDLLDTAGIRRPSSYHLSDVSLSGNQIDSHRCSPSDTGVGQSSTGLYQDSGSESRQKRPRDRDDILPHDLEEPDEMDVTDDTYETEQATPASHDLPIVWEGADATTGRAANISMPQHTLDTVELTPTRHPTSQGDRILDGIVSSDESPPSTINNDGPMSSGSIEGREPEQSLDSPLSLVNHTSHTPQQNFSTPGYEFSDNFGPLCGAQDTARYDNEKVRNRVIENWMNDSTWNFAAEEELDLGPEQRRNAHVPASEVDKSELQNDPPRTDDSGRAKHANPQTRYQPPTSNQAITRFKLRAKDLETCSVAATAGSSSDRQEDFDITSTSQHAEVVKARRDFFASKRADTSLQVVQDLLRKWTIVDRLIIPNIAHENAEETNVSKTRQRRPSFLDNLLPAEKHRKGHA